MIGNCSPSTFVTLKETDNVVPPLEIGEPVIPLNKEQTSSNHDMVIDVTPPLSSFHYQLKKVGYLCCLINLLISLQPWRLPYYDHPVHKEFRTFIYSFTWVGLHS